MVGNVGGFTVMVNFTTALSHPVPVFKKLPNENGAWPTGTVAVTVFVVVLITDRVFEPLLATYNRLPSLLMVMPQGFWPTAMVASTLLVAVLITATVPEPVLVTYNRLPSGLMAMPLGPTEPLTGMVVDSVLEIVLITDTVLLLVFATYNWLPSGLNAIPSGCCPTGILLMTD